MPFLAGQIALLCPAAISIHDNGEVRYGRYLIEISFHIFFDVSDLTDLTFFDLKCFINQFDIPVGGFLHFIGE